MTTSNITISPNAAELATSAFCDTCAGLDADETIVDAWFRTACKVTIRRASAEIVIDDDLGWFFQKWMQLLRAENESQRIYFMGSTAFFSRMTMTLKDQKCEMKIEGKDLLALTRAIAAELDGQLVAMVSFDQNCSADVETVRSTCLTPLLEFCGRHERNS